MRCIGVKGGTGSFRFGLGLRVISHIFQVGFIGVLPIGPPGLGNPCCLLHRDPMPAVRQPGFKDGNRKFVWGCFRLAKEGHILLREHQIRHHEVI